MLAEQQPRTPPPCSLAGGNASWPQAPLHRRGRKSLAPCRPPIRGSHAPLPGTPPLARFHQILASTNGPRFFPTRRVVSLSSIGSCTALNAPIRWQLPTERSEATRRGKGIRKEEEAGRRRPLVRRSDSQSEQSDSTGSSFDWRSTHDRSMERVASRAPSTCPRTLNGGTRLCVRRLMCLFACVKILESTPECVRPADGCRRQSEFQVCCHTLVHFMLSTP